MKLLKIILVLTLLSLITASLFPQRAIALPVEIEVKLPNIKVYAFEKVLDRWGEQEWASFSRIVNKESNWTVNTAHYPTTKKSSAHGLCGFLNQTWVDTGFVKTDDTYTQIDACLVYIENRYGLPSKALGFHNRMGWY